MNKYFKILNRIFKTPIILLCVGVFILSCSEESGTENHVEPFSPSMEYVNDVIENGDRELAFNLLLSKFEEAKIRQDFEKMSEITARIAYLFRKSDNLNEAIIYAKDSKKWALEAKNDSLLLNAEILIGKSYLAHWNNGDENDENTPENKKIRIFIDSAKIQFDNILSEIQNSELNLNTSHNSDEFIEETVASTFANLSAIAFIQKDLDDAEFYANQSYEYFMNNKTERLAIAYNNLGNVKLEKGEYSKAVDYYEKGVETLDDLDSDSYDPNRRINLLVNLAYTKRLMEGPEDLINSYDVFYKAYELENLYKEEKTKVRFAELEKMYNVRRVEEEAAARQKEQEKEAEQFKYFSILLFILTLVLIATFFVFYKGSQLKQKNLELQIDKEQLVQKAELERVEKLSQTKVLNATIDGRESERKLIAEILHDSVSSLLSSANLHLQASRNVYSKVPEEIDKSQRIIEEASEKIRNLSHELISSVLLKFGLSYSIFDLCEKYSNSQIEIVSDINHVRRYDQSFEIKMNNIIEELVNNILKHSKASEAIITLEERNDQLFLEITDNGEGFKFDELIKKDGLGLNQIKARVQMMKGSIDIDSIPTQGTTINIIVPIVEREVRKREMA